jgi:hypothetical protein
LNFNKLQNIIPEDRSVHGHKLGSVFLKLQDFYLNLDIYLRQNQIRAVEMKLRIQKNKTDFYELCHILHINRILKKGEIFHLNKILSYKTNWIQHVSRVEGKLKNYYRITNHIGQSLREYL